ncbi:MAG: peptide deformylase [Clostridium sp.]
MAIRNIRKNGDDVLRKKSKVVDKIDNRTLLLIEDMIDTMYEADGVGLAAPQVGILKRIFVVDIYDDFGARIFINPEILEVKGNQVGEEGCLSAPGEFGDVERPNYVKVKALNEKGEEFILEATEFLARAICHEYDHLEGTLFLDKVID